MRRRCRIALRTLSVAGDILGESRGIPRREHPCAMQPPARVRGRKKRLRIALSRRTQVDPRAATPDDDRVAGRRDRHNRDFNVYRKRPMSAPGRPKRELLPLGGTARSAKGEPLIAPGRPKRELLPLGGTAHSAKGEPLIAPSGPKRELLPLGGTARSAKGEPIRAARPPEDTDCS